MGSLSLVHWVIVLVVVIAIFGTKKLRNVGSDLGAAVKGFKDGLKEGEQSVTEPTAKVTQDAARSTKETIDVEARQKS